MQEKNKVQMRVLIEALNDVFGKETTDQDQLVYMNGVILGEMLESDSLKKQATNKSKEQFAGSPDLKSKLENAVIDALDATFFMKVAWCSS